MRVLARLGSLQFDPIEVAGRNHDLILLARIRGYRREWTETLLYEERRLFEAYNKQLSILPTSELPWYRITWDREHTRHHAETFPEHAEVVADLLERIRAGGPMSSIDVEAHDAIDWYWRPTNRVRALLEALAEAGILGIARRSGNRRYYDLIERLYPAELLAVRPAEAEQLRHKLLSRHRGHGLLGAAGQAELWYGLRSHEVPAEGGSPPGAAESRRRLRDALVEEGALIPVEVDGVRGLRYIVAEDAELLEATARSVAGTAVGSPAAEPTPAGVPGERRLAPEYDAAPHPVAGGPAGPADLEDAAFLAPLDPFVWDRDLLRSLFDFDYVWEVYVPPAKRRWGYYVLPILFGDRLVGRIEPRIDRRTRSLRVIGIWWEAGFDPLADPRFVVAFTDALEAHRAFAGARHLALPTGARHREFSRLVRAARAAGRDAGAPSER